MNDKRDPESDEQAKSDEQNENGTIDEPVLDGADEKLEDDVDPRKGLEDPALIRDVESGEATINPYG
ncbi:MAG: hypothetical protein ACK5LO_12770 [Leucobacter sp.]